MLHVNVSIYTFFWNGAVGYFVIYDIANPSLTSTDFILCLGNDFREVYYPRTVAGEGFSS